MYEWYTFDVSDDTRHNQNPPPAKYINYPVPFHEDDESGLVNLKPKVAANMDWILGWAILGLTLYIVDDWTGDGKDHRLKKKAIDHIKPNPTQTTYRSQSLLSPSRSRVIEFNSILINHHEREGEH
ncbi:unnamed protein product [Camellia sinensis]